MKKLFVFLAVCIFAFNASAQSDPLKRIMIGDIYLFSGNHFNSFDMELKDFISIVPESAILKEDFSKFKHYGIQNNSTLGYNLSMKLGLDFRKKDGSGYRHNPQLQIGLSYMTNNPGNYTMSYNEKFRMDTITSPAFHDVLYVDSINYSYVNAEYHSENLLLDLMLIYRTDAESRWSFYTGIGVAGGISLNSRTEVYRIDDVYSEFNYKGSSFGYPRSIDSSSEYFKNEMNILALFQVPVGVNLRVAKNTKLWKDLNLFYEVSPAVRYLYIPEAGSFIGTGVKHGFGLKFNIRT